MDRYLVISSDCHAGLPPERYREYLDPQYREMFDAALPIQMQFAEEAARKFLVADINREWRKGRERQLSGAWDHDERIQVLDADGIAAEVIFPDGITEANMPPFGAGLSLPTEGINDEAERVLPPQCLLGASCMPRREVEMPHEIGLGNIMCGSDYPHPEGTWPTTREQMAEVFRGVPDAELAAMLGGNAMRLYGFDAAKLGEIAARIGPERSAFTWAADQNDRRANKDGAGSKPAGPVLRGVLAVPDVPCVP